MKITSYNSKEAYIESMKLRSNFSGSEILQIINGEKIKDFHKLLEKPITEEINRRSEKGTRLLNLINFQDRNNPLEVSNPKTLKETRLLEKERSVNDMITIFGNIVTIVKLDIKSSGGIIIEDTQIAESYRTLFFELWENAERI